jgi:transcriptional regulator with XRE-family HTH domain
MATVIVSALGQAKRSKRWLSEATGIAYSTLRRKLQGEADLTVLDLARIARALQVPPASLLPAPDSTDDGSG